MSDFETFEVPSFLLQKGGVLPLARLAYATYGTLNAAGDNAVLLPTFFTGTHLRNEPLFGRGRAIDPARHFVVSVNLFGNGYSSSPSNTNAPQDGPRFPNVTLYDNVACQHRLLTEHLGVRRIALVLGWSMAAPLESRLVVDALALAVERRLPGEGLLAHSDRGSQYASDHYQSLLARHGITCSMSRRADCYDNAVMESFFASVKKEEADRFPSYHEAKMVLFDYIEVFYNAKRRHSTLGQISPAAFERRVAA